MDVWVLTKETGSYSDYSMEVYAVASTAANAKLLATEVLRRKHAAALALRERWRADWKPGGFDYDYQARMGRHPETKTPDEQFPPGLPVFVDLAWEPNPERDGDWHTGTDDGADDTRWSIFRTQLDGLGPDAPEASTHQ